MATTAKKLKPMGLATRTKLTDSREKPHGDLKVQTTVGLGVHWLTPRLGEFTELYPDIPDEMLEQWWSLVAEHPERRELIEAFHRRWPEMLAGEIPGTVDVLAELRAAGVNVPLTVYHEGVTFDVVLTSIDRGKILKAPRLH